MCRTVTVTCRSPDSILRAPASPQLQSNIKRHDAPGRLSRDGPVERSDTGAIAQPIGRSRSSCALMATMIVLSDMKMAPIAGVIRKPVPKVRPAAIGIATAL